jgi:hypothetical protein
MRTNNIRFQTSQESEEWYTPKDIVERVRKVFGGQITLDPASSRVAQKTVQAFHYYTQKDDGLCKDWFGNVFLNPPYNGKSAAWTNKMIEEYESGRIDSGVMLVFTTPGYKWFENLWIKYPICCLSKRLEFVKPTGETVGQSKKGSTLVYFGKDVDRFSDTFEDLGRIIYPNLN